MATSTNLVSNTFTPTSATQPTVSTPPDMVTFSDTRPTQYATGELVLAAAGSATLLPIPATWTAVYSVTLVNVDAAGYAQLVTYGAVPATPTTYVNPQYRILAPNGGFYTESCLLGGQAGIAYNRPLAYTLEACSAAGDTTAGAATRVYFYMTGA